MKASSNEFIEIRNSGLFLFCQRNPLKFVTFIQAIVLGFLVHIMGNRRDKLVFTPPGIKWAHVSLRLTHFTLRGVKIQTRGSYLITHQCVPKSVGNGPLFCTSYCFLYISSSLCYTSFWNVFFHFLPSPDTVQKMCKRSAHFWRADEAEKKGIPSVALQVPFLTTWVGSGQSGTHVPQWLSKVRLRTAWVHNQ